MHLRLLTLTIFLVAQTALAGEPPEEASDPDDVIDEITVSATQTPTAIRRQLIAVENGIYAMFNALNDDDRYDIVCRKETRIGSQIPQRVCLTRIYREALAQATEDEDAAVGGVGANVFRGPGIDASRHNEILRQKMAHIANENPELMVALRKRLELERSYAMTTGPAHSGRRAR